MSSSTQYQIVESMAGLFIRVYHHLEYLMAQGKLVCNDDTHCKILSVIAANKENPSERTSMFTTAIVGFAGEYKIILFYVGSALQPQSMHPCGN